MIEKQELIDEIEADEKLTEFKQQEDNFVGLSFDTISATGANGAVIHYKPTKGQCSTINPRKLYLNDSGSQFWKVLPMSPERCISRNQVLKKLQTIHWC